MSVVGIRDRGGRDGTGRAVAVTISSAADTIVDRRDLDLVGPEHDGRIYHVAQSLPVDEALALVDGATRASAVRAYDEIEKLLRDIDAVDAVAIPLSETHEDVLTTELSTVLASHTRIHDAETALYREALVEACGDHGLTVHRFAVETLDPSSTRLAQLARGIGRPWRRHHKEAALAALAALSSPASR